MEEVIINLIGALVAGILLGLSYFVYASLRSIRRIKRDISYADNVSCMLRDRLIEMTKNQNTNLIVYNAEIKKLNENIYLLQKSVHKVLKDFKINTVEGNVYQEIERQKSIDDTVSIISNDSKVINFQEVYDNAIKLQSDIAKQLEEVTKIDFENVDNDINFLNTKFENTKVKEENERLPFIEDIPQFITLSDYAKIMEGKY